MMVLRALVLVAVGAMAANDGDGEFNPFVIMIDAASSKTKAHLYQWEPSTDASDSRPNVTKINTVKHSNFQFASLTEDELNKTDNLLTSNLAEMLESLLNNTDAKGKKARCFVKATAGMRLVPAPLETAIMEAAADFLTNYEDVTFVSAETIAGEEEGAFAWLAETYHYDNSLKKTTGKVGALDLGGMSSQISWSPASRVLGEALTISLGLGDENTFKTYSNSFLGGGNDGIRERVLKYAFAQEGKQSPCFASDIQVPPKDVGTVTAGSISGTGNFGECVGLIKTFMPIPTKDYCYFNKLDATADASSHCTIGGDFLPTVQGAQFYAMGTYIYAAEALEEFNANSPKFTEGGGSIAQFKEGAAAFCASTGAANSELTSYGWTYCTSMSLVTFYLEDAFQLTGAPNIIFSEEVGGANSEWALGATLYEVHKLELAKGCDEKGDSGDSGDSSSIEVSWVAIATVAVAATGLTSF